MGTSILIIDDNQGIRENAQELLSLAGYITSTAKNGKEGLEIINNQRVDLVLCDIMMPELDGYGVLRAMENIPEKAGLPFIFMSAKTEKADFRKGMDLGADDYLPKPFSGDDLLRIVNARLKKNHLIKQSNVNSVNLIKPEINPELNLSSTNMQKKLRKKDLLFTEGDSANYLYFIKSGKIKVFKTNEWGKEYIVDIHAEGAWLGYMAILDNTEHKMSAMALEPTEVNLIPRQEFLNLISSNSESAMKFIRTISSEFSDAIDKIIRMAYDSARKRVAEALLYLNKKYQSSGNNLTFIMQRENISAISGISPESVSRNLGNFKEEGLIETINGNIRILNINKLQSIKN